MQRIWILASLSLVLGCGLLADLSGTRCNTDGSCGNGLVCLEGRCEASCGALTECEGRCVDLQSDPASCGACGTACATGEACVAGGCSAELPDGGEADAGVGDGGTVDDAGVNDAGTGDAGSDDAGTPAIDPGGPKPICGAAGWCWENPTPQGEDLIALHAFGPDHVWATGRMGMTMRWNGQYWTSHPVPGIEPDLYAIHGLEPDDLWVVGQGGRVAHWNGTAWTAHPHTFYESLHAVWVIDPNHVLTVGDGGAVRVWDGTAWNVIVTANSSPAWTALWGDGNGSVRAVGLGGRIGTYSYNASAPADASAGKWAESTLASLPDLHAITGNGTAVYAGGSGGTVLTLGTEGLWTELAGKPGNVTSTIRSLHLEEDGTLWGVTENGWAFWGTAGESLTSTQLQPGSNLWAVRGLGGGRALAVGQGGAQLWREALGPTFVWRNKGSGATDGIVGVAAGGEDAYAITPNSLMRRLETGQWEDAFTLPFTPHAIATDASGTTVWIVGENGNVLHSADRMQARASVENSGGHYHGVAIASEDFAIVVGENQTGTEGVIERCDPNGCTVLAPPGFSPAPLRTVWAASEELFWAAGTGGELVRFDAGAWTQQWPAAVPRPEMLHAIWGRSDGDVWIGGVTSNAGPSLIHWNGSAFADHSSELESGVLGIAGTGTQLFTAGVNGAVYEFDTTSGSFRKRNANVHYTLRGLAASTDAFFAVGPFGTILRRGQ